LQVDKFSSFLHICSIILVEESLAKRSFHESNSPKLQILWNLFSRFEANRKNLKNLF